MRISYFEISPPPPSLFFQRALRRRLAGRHFPVRHDRKKESLCCTRKRDFFSPLFEKLFRTFESLENRDQPPSFHLSIKIYRKSLIDLNNVLFYFFAFNRKKESICCTPKEIFFSSLRVEKLFPFESLENRDQPPSF